ncbi:HAD-IA family hydrolase [Patescibacteria group bacterium]|nr:HAD-IA family hydrolase [Patescibacteria group bacterium]
MKKPVRFIYFDVGGVFLDWKEGHRRAAKKYNVTAEEIGKITQANMQAAFVGSLSGTDYMARFAQLLKLTEPYPDFAEFWTDFHVPIPEMHAFARSLHPTHKLGLLTNAETGSMRQAVKKGLVPDVAWKAVVDSSVFKAKKPDPGIFEIAEKEAGVAPHEILFVDDQPENIEAVHARGWQGIVFDTGNVTVSIEAIKVALK